MNPPLDDPCRDALHQASARDTGLYEPSITSSASSSHCSIFSEPFSAHSSIASSISDDFPHSHDDLRNRVSQLQPKVDYENARPSYAAVTSASTDQRPHPRRSSLARNQRPPPLVRQCERKINFVDNLVDSATQMVEVIWPLAVASCREESGAARGVLPLRTYIEETLRRSRTSYSTLQVALYYLILIRPFVPKTDSTMKQKLDCPTTRALVCGRRMFLAALILASKYLQDRNYSAKAWSKMSGLQVNEINSNEKIFLEKVNWKLHIPETIFKRWTEVVLRYTPNMPPPSPPSQSIWLVGATWQSIVPLLTPELDKIPELNPYIKPAMPRCPANFGLSSSISQTPPKTAYQSSQNSTVSNDTTPTPMTVLPRYLDTRPNLVPPTPALVRMGPLPTPTLSPVSVASCTPAASAIDPRPSSMSHAMATAHKACIKRYTNDIFPHVPPAHDPRNSFSRRPSLASATSLSSSPESMMSDRSRSSRASSISSISTVSTAASMAPGRACLARQATCRSARLPIPMSREVTEGTATRPIVVADDAGTVHSPELVDFSVSEKVLTTPHRHSKRALAPSSAPTPSEKSRKRARPRGGRRSDLQEEVRCLLEEDLEAMMVEDLEHSSPSATEQASEMRPQSPSSLSWHSPSRVAVQKNAGKKRTCCVVSATSIPPSSVYGVV